MNRVTWTDLATFAAVARAGSFTKAGVELGVTGSAVSHALRGLEARLGIRLLNRSTRSVSPTQAGQELLASLLPGIDALDDALARLELGRDRPGGRLRVSAHRAAAMHLILPRLSAFCADYPDIEFELAVEDGLTDIVSAGFDAGVRHGHVLDGDMISVRISDAAPLAVVAAPHYLDAHGRPSSPDGLLQHRGLVLRLTSSGALHHWRFEKDGQVLSIDPPPSFVSNDVDVLLEAAASGMGITIVAPQAAAPFIATGRLEQVLADWSPAIPANYLYFPSRRHLSPALRAFVDAMRLRPG